MDENKVAALRAAGYKVGPACGLCVFGTFRNGSRYGECGRHTYDHKRHDNPDGGRPLSIHAYGHCPQYETRDLGSLLSNPGYLEFVDLGTPAPDSERELGSRGD